VLSLHGAARQSPNCRAWPQSLDLAFQQAGLALTGIEIPRAFHGFNQRLGTNRRGSIEGQRFAGTAIEGPHWPFGLCAPSHPFAKRMTTGPVRALRLPVAGPCFLVGPCGFPWTHRRDASNPLLQPTFRVTSTRSKNTLFGDFPPSAVGNPAGVRLRDPPRTQRRRVRSRKTPDHLAVIQPPTASCLTARCRLRVERRPRCAFALHGESAAAFFGCVHASPLGPSDTFLGDWKESA
jgi:hypothetical protein